MRDQVPEIISALSEGTGIDFVRDAWVDENGEMGRRDYGVVTVIGSPLALWGDDKLIAQIVEGEIILYVMDGDDSKAAAVQNVLKEMEIPFRLKSCVFDREIAANRWIWGYSADEYLNGSDEGGDSETGTDGDADSDSETDGGADPDDDGGGDAAEGG